MLEEFHYFSNFSYNSSRKSFRNSSTKSFRNSSRIILRCFFLGILKANPVGIHQEFLRNSTKIFSRKYSTTVFFQILLYIFYSLLSEYFKKFAQTPPCFRLSIIPLKILHTHSLFFIIPPEF